MKFDACETCARIYSENNYVCFTCRDGHHKMKGEEMNRKNSRVYTELVNSDFLKSLCKLNGWEIECYYDNFTASIAVTVYNTRIHSEWNHCFSIKDWFCVKDIVRYIQLEAENYFNPSPKIDYTKIYKTTNLLSEFEHYKATKRIPEIKNVIFNDPATIVFWVDGTKTVVKCQEGDIYDPEKGLAMAISRKALGNRHDYYNVFKKWLKKAEKKKDVECLYPDTKKIAEIGKSFLEACKEWVEKFNKNGFTLSNELKEALLENGIDPDYGKTCEGIESLSEDLRCTVCQNIRFDDDQESYYCTLDGKTIDPADPACQYFDHETMTCWDCKMSECIPVNEEGSCVDLMCTTTGEKPIDRSEAACRNFVFRK